MNLPRFITVPLLVFHLLLLAHPSNAQSEDPLEQYIKIGLENNEKLIQERLEVELQEARLQEAKGNYLPDVSFDASYIRADGGRIIQVPAGDLVNPAYEGLNQLFGAEVYPTNIQNTEEQFLPDNFHETKIRIIQPILNAKTHFNRKIQQSLVEAKRARKNAYQNELVKQIKTAYYNHASAVQQLEILNSTTTVLQELLRFNQSLFENQKVTREVVLQSEADISNLESRIASAEKQLAVSLIYFNYLIGRNLNDSIRLNNSESPENKLLSTSELTAKALNNRFELRELDASLESLKQNTRLSKSYLIPEINVIGDVGYQGFGYEFNDTQDFWFLRFGLSWPIFQGNKNRSKVQQATLQQRQLQSRQKETEDLISLEVTEAKLSLDEAYKIARAKQMERQQAEESFKIIRKQYEQNQTTQLNLIEARNKMTVTQIQEVIARNNVKIAHAHLEAAISNFNP